MYTVALIVHNKAHLTLYGFKAKIEIVYIYQNKRSLRRRLNNFGLRLLNQGLNLCASLRINQVKIITKQSMGVDR